MIKLFCFFLLQVHFYSYIIILIKAIVWPNPVDHPHKIKLEMVVNGCFVFHFISFTEILIMLFAKIAKWFCSAEQDGHKTTLVNVKAPVVATTI